MPSRRSLLLVVLLLFAGIPAGVLPHPASASTPAPASAPDTPDAVTGGTGVNRLSIGVTHTQRSADLWDTSAAAKNARSLLARIPRYQNQHIMGWGALNPNPAPGVYDWRSLDARLDLIRSTGGTPVITLCCSPDWMKGGAAGTTDWARLEVAPRREHFADFAELARRVALRYPDVGHFQVWNELKGFHDPTRNRWDIESYTELYNLVHAAVKSVRPTAKVGGPYIVMESWSAPDRMSHPSDVRGPWGAIDQRAMDAVDHWLEHSRGADFLALDLFTGTRDAGMIVDEFAAATKFRAVMAWVRSRTDLPVWMSEWYALADETDTDLQRQSAVMLTAVAEMARAGVDVALQWGPQADGSSCIGGCLWTDPARSGGGRETPTLTGFDAFTRAFPPGVAFVAPVVTSPAVTELSSRSRTMLVNRRSVATTVSVDGRSVTLGRFETRFLDRQPTPK